MSKVKIALVQCTAEADPHANLKKALDCIRQASAKGAQIVCLQELYRSKYFCQEYDHRQFDLAETIPGPSTHAFSK